MTLPVALYLLPPEKFPVHVELIGRGGSVVWSYTMKEPPHRSNLVAIRIPSFADTEHFPVTARVTYGDGTVDEG